MAVKKFLKLYNVRSDDIDDRGNINPNAALYPLFASDYIDNKTGQLYSDLSPDEIPEHLSDEDLPYDNSTNAHPERTVVIRERRDDEDEDEDSIPNIKGRTSPNMKRGFSVLAYSNRSKRNGKDYFNNWKMSTPNVHYIDYFPNFENTSDYADNYASPQSDVDMLSDIMYDYGNNSGNTGPCFVSVPLIITAEDSDIVDIDDVLNNNYDPIRDFPSEQQIKRIIKRSVIPKEYYNIQTLNSSKIAWLKGMISKCKAVMTSLLNSILSLKDINPQNTPSLLNKLEVERDRFNNLIDGYNFKGNTSTIQILRQLTDVAIELADESEEVITCILRSKKAVDRVYDAVKSLYFIPTASGDEIDNQVQYIKQAASKAVSYISYTITLCTKTLNVLNRLEHSNISIPIKMSYDFSKILGKGGAFDWADSTTSSDERIKNILDTGKQVILSDKQQKYILDDFNDFCDSYQKHNNVLKGIKEVGQW